MLGQEVAGVASITISCDGLDFSKQCSIRYILLDIKDKAAKMYIFWAH